MWLQYLLPRYALTALVARVSRISQPRARDFLITRFATLYDIDLDEVGRPAPDGFRSLNDFFTRELKPGARPIDSDPTSVVAPADGRISAIGRIERDQILQAKGKTYSLHEFLSTNLADANAYVGGQFATIYLAPHNYHRVHAPVAGRLERVHYVPGDLFSVNDASAAAIPNLFCRNERLIMHLDSAAGPVAVVLVGALNVGSISTPWTGEIRPEKRGVGREIRLEESSPRTIAKGDLLGWFNMGSTVVILFQDGAVDWLEAVETGSTTRVGRPLAHHRVLSSG